MAITVGIDLGTTNSACCTLRNGKFHFLKFKREELLPSAILWQGGKLTVGSKARKRSVIYAQHFIKSSKTFMGDPEKKWVIEGRTFTPTDVATEILAYIKKQAAKAFGSNDMTAVITVPAYFTSNQINETKIAGERAGFKIKQILTEPVAAAIAYGFEDQKDQKIFVVDIGGGTFDVSILEIKGNDYQTIAIDGDNRLGGDDFDDVILQMCFKQIRQTLGVDLSNLHPSDASFEELSNAKLRLMMAAEEAKKELSNLTKVQIQLPRLFTHRGITRNFSRTISRNQFEQESSHLLNKIKRTIKHCLDDASMAPSEIDKVILVGGTSYMPVVQDYVTELFGKTPHSDKDLSKLVTMGAALVADNEHDTIQVRDIIAHSLGIELVGKRMSKILLKNEFYPVSKSKKFTTVEDYQTEVEISVFEGEDETSVDNNHLYGSFNLSGIERAKARVPSIEVTFSFDKSRNLQVTAKDLRTGSQESKTIKITRT